MRVGSAAGDYRPNNRQQEPLVAMQCSTTDRTLLLPSSENRFMRAIRPTPISSIALPSPAVQVSGGGVLRNRHAGRSDAAEELG